MSNNDLSEKLGIPDYASNKTITFPFTATKNGIILVSTTGSNVTGELSIFINNIRAGYFRAVNGGGIELSAIIGSGDVATVTSTGFSSIGARFVPYK